MSEAQEPVNIVSLKWGDRYGPEFANRLYNGVAKNLNRPFRFICFTDQADGLHPNIEPHPLPPIVLPESHQRTTWLKLGLFMDGLADMQGDCMFLDLDLLITGNIDCFFEYMPGKRCIIHNWNLRHHIFRKRPDVGNSSVFRWRANTTQFIVDKFYAEADWAMANFKPPQTYLTYGLGEKYWWPEEWAQSFKRHCIPLFPLNLMQTPKLPSDARMVVFHGLPDPDQALEGFKAKRIHRSCKATPWIEDFWDESGADGA